MLSVRQQNMLIWLLQKPVTSKSMMYSRSAFYRSMGYLEENNLIQKVPEGRSYIIELTIKGRFLAKMLAGFTDVEDKIRRRYGAQ